MKMKTYLPGVCPRRALPATLRRGAALAALPAALCVFAAAVFLPAALPADTAEGPD
jgi:hypothetical protein